ncbi:unnamed protein product [Rangifer tarandus platyrhynchus]|uniref:Uncharacterized protein n=2 Tax=Rangifer tarandus platyrhynchus TaxID=3082113 RepID=A0ABN8YTF4_RANTA|nr:unnamed protein product [Rangifer tarandus platyrhynchus]CAI9702438.1 unnamed protein product [Rangifer tarandus platyrhynchus]
MPNLCVLCKQGVCGERKPDWLGQLAARQWMEREPRSLVPVRQVKGPETSQGSRESGCSGSWTPREAAAGRRELRRLGCTWGRLCCSCTRNGGSGWKYIGQKPLPAEPVHQAKETVHL